MCSSFFLVQVDFLTNENILFGSMSICSLYGKYKKMICPVKSANLIFTFLILSCCFPRAAKKQKKAIVSISSTKQQRDDDSSRTICTKNLFWSLSLSKSCKDLERIVIYICEWRFVAVHSLSWALSRRHKNDSLSYAWWTEKPTLVHSLSSNALAMKSRCCVQVLVHFW